MAIKPRRPAVNGLGLRSSGWRAIPLLGTQACAAGCRSRAPWNRSSPHKGSRWILDRCHPGGQGRHELPLSLGWKQPLSGSLFSISTGWTPWAFADRRPGHIRLEDRGWPGLTMHGQVIYELHIGAFTPEGTFDAAVTRLDTLKDLGITVIEIMPVAEFPGRWNWGYDGVGLYAPAHVYSEPDALKRFVDEAHLRGLGVILDVVYNHLGPDGNYLPAFSDEYLTDRYPNEWGQAINFDGPGSKEVREFYPECLLLDRRVSSRWPQAGCRPRIS